MSSQSSAADDALHCWVCGVPACGAVALTVAHQLFCHAPLCHDHIGSVRRGSWGLNVQWQDADRWYAAVAPCGDERALPVALPRSTTPACEGRRDEQ